MSETIAKVILPYAPRSKNFASGSTVIKSGSTVTYGSTLQVIKQSDTTIPTDENTFSSLKSLKTFVKRTENGAVFERGSLSFDVFIDDNGKLCFDGDIYATGSVGAFGAGADGSGGGVIENVYGMAGFGGSYGELDYTNTFNAFAINSLHGRLNSLEAGSALSVETSGVGNAITSLAKIGTRLVATAALTFALAGHVHAKSDITDFPTTWDWASLINTPSTYAPSAHTHSIVDLTNFPSTWAWDSVTGKPTTLLGYGITDAAPSSHVGDISHLTVAQRNVLSMLSVVDSKLKVTGDFYATGSVGAFGTGTGQGGGVVGTVYGSAYLGGSFSDLNLTDTFNAYTINSVYTGLNSRVASLEGGSALTFNSSGDGNAVTSISKTGTVVTVYKNSTFSLSGHTHTVSSITDFPTTWAWLSLTGVPSTFTPSAHTHTKANITDFPTVVSAFTNDSAYITGITKSMVETVLTGAITTHSHDYDASGTASGLMTTHTTSFNHSHIANGKSAFDWGDHSLVGYGLASSLTSHIETNLHLTDSQRSVLGMLSVISGKLAVTGSFYATGSVGAYGAGTGEGGGVVSSVLGSSYLGGSFVDTDLTTVFNAYTVNYLHGRLNSLEAGSALNFETSGTGNAVTGFSKTGNTVTLVKGSTFSVSGHTHSKSDITDFPTTWAWSALSGVPSSFTPSAHTHPEIPFLNIKDAQEDFVGYVPTISRSSNPNPNAYGRSFSGEFKYSSYIGLPNLGWSSLITIAGYNGAEALSNYQLNFAGADATPRFAIRAGIGETWGSWYNVWHAANSNLPTVDWNAKVLNAVSAKFSQGMRVSFNDIGVDTGYIYFGSTLDRWLGYDGVNFQIKPDSSVYNIYHSGNSNQSTVDWVANNVVAYGNLGVLGELRNYSSIKALNNAGTGFVTWANRNTSGSEVVMDLSNIGTVSAGNGSFSSSLYARKLSTSSYSDAAHGFLNANSSLSLGMADNYAYGISTNENGGLDIIANQSGQSIFFYAGGTPTIPHLSLILNGDDRNAYFAAKISATTGIFSNLTAGVIPMHTSGGLADSWISTNGVGVGIGITNPSGGRLVVSQGSGIPDLEISSRTRADAWGVGIRATGGSYGSALRLMSSTGSVQMIDSVNDYTLALYQADGSTAGVFLRANGISYFNGGNVGIGTTNPLNKLDVNVSGSAGEGIVLSNGGAVFSKFGMVNYGTDNTTYIGSFSNNDFAIYSVGAERVRIDITGNVGIGVIPTNFILKVAGTTGIAARSTGVDGVFQDILTGYYSGNENEQNAIQTSVSSVGEDSGFNFMISDGGGLSTQKQAYRISRASHRFYINGAEKVTIDNSGSVFIGYTSDPTSNNTLAVNGNTFTKGLTVSNGTQSVNITVDANGNLAFGGNAYSTGSLGAFGLGTGGGSGGIGTIIDSSYLGGLFSDVDVTTTFNAYTINYLHARIATLEAASANWSTAYGWGNHATVGYLTGITKSQVEAVLTGGISSHTHSKASITDFPTSWAWSALSGVPSTFAPSAHSHNYLALSGGTLTGTLNSLDISLTGMLRFTNGVFSLYNSIEGESAFDVANYTMTVNYAANFQSTVYSSDQGTFTGLTVRNASGQTVNITVDANGRLAIGGSAYATGSIGAYGEGSEVLDAAPSSATAQGNAGERRYASDGIYLCIATNTWRKVSLSTF